MRRLVLLLLFVGCVFPVLALAQETGSQSVSAAAVRAKVQAAGGDTAAAQRIMNGYLAGLSEAELYTKDNLELLRSATFRSTDRGFALFRRHGARADSVLGQPGAAQGVVDRIIVNEEIRPIIAASTRGGPPPDWARITAAIAQKYGAEAGGRTVVPAKINWYRAQKVWPEYVENLVINMETYVLREKEIKDWGTARTANDAAWDVFLYGNDKAALTKALGWSERANRAYPDAEGFDTYANLLYKLGRTEQALRWQEVAAKLQPTSAEITGALEKMKKGEATWAQH